MTTTLNRKDKEFKVEKLAEQRIQELQNFSPMQDMTSENNSPSPQNVTSENNSPSPQDVTSENNSPSPIPSPSSSPHTPKIWTTKPPHPNQTTKASSPSPFPPLINSIKNKPIQAFIADMIRPQRYLSGNHMSKAIDVLRSKKTQKLFIASAEAASQISNWRLHSDWKEFGKIFFSYEVMHHKPNGIYLLPLFTGQDSSGHWYLCVIQKLRQRAIKAWCLDSLGDANMCSIMANKIKTAFSPGRGRFEWIPQNCRTQQEVECGHRTILAMKIIQEGLANSTPLEVCIQKATLHHPPFNLLSPTFIRESIAGFVNGHTPSMTLAPIRIRPRQERNHQRPAQRAKKNIVKSDIIDLRSPSHSQKHHSTHPSTCIEL